MDSSNEVKNEIISLLADLSVKFEKFKKKIDKMCENTECFHEVTVEKQQKTKE